MIKESFIGLGSNLVNPMEQINRALLNIEKMPEVRINRISSFYQSKPWGIVDQPHFINAVIQIQTDLSPLDLLNRLQQIEKQQGRVKTAERYGPRVIDLDILLFDNLELNLPQLIIPHPYLTEREFVIYPLVEIAADLVLPNGQRVIDLKNSMDQRGIIRIE